MNKAGIKGSQGIVSGRITLADRSVVEIKTPAEAIDQWLHSQNLGSCKEQTVNAFEQGLEKTEAQTRLGLIFCAPTWETLESLYGDYTPEDDA